MTETYCSRPGYRRGACIFVDILGTKNTDSFDKKYFIHNEFHDEAAFSGQLGHEHTVFRRKVFSFSDCAYWLYYYKDGLEESRKNDRLLMQVALKNVGLSILNFYHAGFIVRGGACFGDFYFDEKGFFGPAIERAFILESKKAILPRIKIDDEIGRSIFELERGPKGKRNFNSNIGVVSRNGRGFYMNEFYHLSVSSKIMMGKSIISLASVVSSLRNLVKAQMPTLSRKKDIAKLEYIDQIASGMIAQVRSDIFHSALSMAELLAYGEISDDQLIEIINHDACANIHDFFTADEVREMLMRLRLGMPEVHS